ncbi:MAG: DUF2236 domain-containing protein [Brevundimonas sp.]|nr:DUF2236 domain-containing protein [Brevundimonas sp.]
MSPALPLELAKRAVRQKITDVFNDASKGERPVLRRADALFPPDSVAWKVNGGRHHDDDRRRLGPVAADAPPCGFWPASGTIPISAPTCTGGSGGTAKFIATTTYDHAEAGQAAIDRVNRIHAKLRGVLPDGTPYRVSDPELLAWVHVTETISFLDAWIRYAEPRMSLARQDAYFAETARIGEALHAHPVPRTRAEAEALIQSFRPKLRADARTHEVAALVMRQTVGMPAVDLAAGVIMQAGMDLLPDWARAMHRQPRGLPGTLVRSGALTNRALSCAGPSTVRPTGRSTRTIVTRY